MLRGLGRNDRAASQGEERAGPSAEGWRKLGGAGTLHLSGESEVEAKSGMSDHASVLSGLGWNGFPNSRVAVTSVDAGTHQAGG